jgi:hypothetical protein
MVVHRARGAWLFVDSGERPEARVLNLRWQFPEGIEMVRDGAHVLRVFADGRPFADIGVAGACSVSVEKREFSPRFGATEVGTLMRCEGSPGTTFVTLFVPRDERRASGLSWEDGGFIWTDETGEHVCGDVSLVGDLPDEAPHGPALAWRSSSAGTPVRAWLALLLPPVPREVAASLPGPSRFTSRVWTSERATGWIEIGLPHGYRNASAD